MNLIIEKREPDGTVRVDMGRGPTRHSMSYVIRVLESAGLDQLAKSVQRGEWVDVALNRAEQIDVLKRALG